ncbi:phosphatase PAP2 family protein [Selenomonas sp. WCA-380-WT-3B 3/]|uniref:Phosphatase PAP2 family protein n=1 Tax=Selenomonas montiformis TaxID=2652285 RepID=A0A6I2UXM7_9FIRM|nr:phosphatase PAP2 family protein [Selenomonas montiformis]MSV24834.1 phosphatase PAP2 family protein [Selenomonas montiformis]
MVVHAVRCVCEILGVCFGFVSSFVFAGACAAGVFAVALILLRAWYRWLALAMAVLIVFSRLYVGMHYPSDVLGGFPLAYIVSFLVWRFLGEGIAQPAKS